MNERLLGAYLYSQIRFREFGDTVKQKVKDVFTEETGEVNVVAIVVLIGVAVGLALFFKDQIASILSGLFTSIEDGTAGFQTKPSKSATP